MSVSSSVAVHKIVPKAPEKPTAKFATGPCVPSIQPISHLQFISTYEYYLQYNVNVFSVHGKLNVLRK